MRDKDIRRIIRECIDKYICEQVICEDSAEDATWNGKNYAYYREGVECVAFFILNNGAVICGDGSYRQTHEEILLRFCYDLLDKEPPINPITGRFDFNGACREIEIGHSGLFNRIHDKITVQGRIFKTDDGKYVFSCYELLDDSEARGIMKKVSDELKIDAEKCYYVGHYNTKIVPLTEKNE